MLKAWDDICVVETWSLSFPQLIKCVGSIHAMEGEEDFVGINQDQMLPLY